MVPTLWSTTESVPPPAYHRAVAPRPRRLHIDALTLVTTLHLLALCRLAVRQAHQICPPPLRRGPGGAPRRYQEESLLLTWATAHAGAAVIPGHARLVGQLAGVGRGLRAACGCARGAPRPPCRADGEARGGGGGTSVRDARGGRGAGGPAATHHRRP